MLIFCAFIQVYVFSTNHHLKAFQLNKPMTSVHILLLLYIIFNLYVTIIPRCSRVERIKKYLMIDVYMGRRKNVP